MSNLLSKNYLSRLRPLFLGCLLGMPAPGLYAQARKTMDLMNLKGNGTDVVHTTGAQIDGDGGGGNFYWDENATDDADSVTVIKAGASEKGRWKRELPETNTYDARWWGCKFDGSTDDTYALQRALDDCLHKKGATLVLPQGVAVITHQLNLGSEQQMMGTQTSFRLIGQGMNSSGSIEGGGTILKWMGPAGPGTILLNIKPSAARFLSFARFTMESPKIDGIETLLNYETAIFTFFQFDEVEFTRAETCVKLNAGGQGNGEFVEYHRCRFLQFSRNGYWQDAPQAMGQKFNNCKFVPLPGAVVWNFVAATGGQFIENDISYGRKTGTGTNTILKVGGNLSDPLLFLGGRWEGTDQLVQFGGSDNISVSFEGVFIGVNRNDTAERVAAVDFGSKGAGRVTLRNCSLGVSSGDKFQQRWVINTGQNRDAQFLAENCFFNNLKPVVTAQLSPASDVGFSNTHPANNTSVVIKDSWEKFNTGAVEKEIPLNSVLIDNKAPDGDAGLQQNYLLESGYAENGAKAASPWAQTGQGVSVTATAPTAGPSGSAFSKTLTFFPQSGLYQDLTGLNIGTAQSKVVYYKASLRLGGGGLLHLALVNSSTGKVYDELSLYPDNSQHNGGFRTVGLQAFIQNGEPGSLRLVEENTDAAHPAKADISWQMVSTDPNATFAATAGTAVTRWEEQPKEDAGNAPPTDGYWPKGFIRYNNNPDVGKPLGWICTQAGQPGTWHTLAKIEN